MYDYGWDEREIWDSLRGRNEPCSSEVTSSNHRWAFLVGRKEARVLLLQLNVRLLLVASSSVDADRLISRGQPPGIFIVFQTYQLHHWIGSNRSANFMRSREWPTKPMCVRVYKSTVVKFFTFQQHSDQHSDQHSLMRMIEHDRRAAGQKPKIRCRQWTSPEPWSQYSTSKTTKWNQPLYPPSYVLLDHRCCQLFSCHSKSV